MEFHMIIFGLTLTGLIWIFLFGALSGYIASGVIGVKNLGFIATAIIGVIGAFIGNFLLSLIGIHFWGLIGSIFTSVLGASLLMLVIGKTKN
jgi:uncharacterized membrane protein YeaQ/YmgE (transglycosylase-associated protein family)